MTVRTSVEPLGRDIQVVLDQELSPEARSRALATFARETLKDAKLRNAQALGRVPSHATFVDGRAEAPLESVRLDGVIVFEFELIGVVMAWIGEQLVRHSPVKSGRFSRSFLFFVDGTELAPSLPLSSKWTEAVFLNTQPYARKIERGQSAQAADGVFEAVAALASRRFGNMAKVRFSFRTPIGGTLARGKLGYRSGNRTPAIVITPR